MRDRFRCAALASVMAVGLFVLSACSDDRKPPGTFGRVVSKSIQWLALGVARGGVVSIGRNGGESGYPGRYLGPSSGWLVAPRPM